MKSDKFDLRVETLRGLAAIMVILGHLRTPEWFDNLHTVTDILPVDVHGHVFVLVFFMLSGYVIGLSYPKSQLGQFSASTYLKKRAIRLYPIYIVTILFSIWVIPQHWQRVLSNLLFLQNLASTTILADGPLWTLNHEVVYYLLFLLLAKTRISPFWALGLAILCSLSSLVYPPIYPMIPGYGTGFCYWCVGLIIAWYFPLSSDKEETGKERFFIPTFFLLLASSFANVLYGLIPALPYNRGWGQQDLVSIYDWVYFTFVLAVFLAYSRRSFRYLLHLTLLNFAIVTLSTLYLGYKGGWDTIPIHIFLLIGMSFVLYFVPLKSSWVERFTYCGSISYGLYVIHMPLLRLFKQLDPASATLGAYTMKVILYFSITFMAAYLLEKIFQPRVKRLLVPSKKESEPKAV